MKTIFIVVTHGFHVRNILYSDIFKKLKEKTRVVIFCPFDDVPNFIREFGDNNVLIEPLLSHFNKKIERILQIIRKYILCNPKRSRTISIFSMIWKRDHYFLYYLFKILNHIFGRFKFLRDIWLKIESFFVDGKEYESIFRKFNPDIVFTCTYGTNPDEIRILRYAKKYNIKTVSVVLSWDNLTSKGIIGARPDKLIVWGNIMKTEAIEIHDYREEDIFIGGAPQLDIYSKKNLFRSREEFCKDKDFDPNKKIIFFGTITPKYFPYNIEMVNILVECINKRLFKYPCQVLVRLHPQVVDNSVWSDKLSDYREIENKYPFVRCDIPKIKKWLTMSPPDRSDSLNLAELLYYSDVCLHPGSTLTVDAAMIDRPIVGIGFDGYQKLDYGSSIRRFFDFTHHLPAVKTGGIKIANNIEELVSYINAYLDDPSLDREARRKIVDIECHKALDGRSGERIANYIFQEIGI